MANARVSSVKSDLDFYDLMVEYVSDPSERPLTSITSPAISRYTLGFSVDVFDGKTLIDTIDRTQLPGGALPLQDRRPAGQRGWQAHTHLIKQFSKYVLGWQSAHRARAWRQKRYRCFTRAAHPYAHQIGDTAAVVIIRQSGAAENYTIAWSKSGTPLTTLGASPPRARRAVPRSPSRALRCSGLPWTQERRKKFHNYTPSGHVNIVGWVMKSQPVWALPEGFGSAQPAAFDAVIFAGTYKGADGGALATSEFPILSTRPPVPWTGNVPYMQTNTDVLVVDADAKSGGGCVPR